MATSGHAYSEQDVCKNICKEIFSPLCANDVVLEKRYNRTCGIPGLSYNDLGLGTPKTWHGTPDVVVRGTAVVVSSPGEDLEVHEAEDSDDGASADDFDDSASVRWTQVQAQRNIRVSHLPEVIATNIVASFTESNCHLALNPMVPTIQIDSEKFRVILYDCKKDVLLMSPLKMLTNVKKPRLSITAMTMLWVVINHRYAFVSYLVFTVSSPLFIVVVYSSVLFVCL